MSTRRELYTSIEKELFTLSTAWRETFMRGKTEDEQTEILEEDLCHPPAAMGVFLAEVVQEFTEAINRNMDRARLEGEIGNNGKDAFDYATKALASTCVLIGQRMFRLGQLVSYKLKYDDLTPCVCSIVPDDELEEFLRRATEGPKVVEGEGWVIPDFKKEEK